MSDISPYIFRAYDIRGVVSADITEDSTYLIGRAIGSEVIAAGQKKLFIARDGRISGERLSEKLAQGLMDSGCHVIDLGMTTTPVLYFACKTHPKVNSGVMLTASHNPSNYNGMKMVINGQVASSEKIQQLYQRIVADDFSQGEGSIGESQKIKQNYFETICQQINLEKPLKIVIDCANAVAGLIAPKLFKQLGCKVIELYCDIDGTFPNHEADPSHPENLQDLIKAVKYHQADIGLAFDGDADRVFTVTRRGKIIYPDHMLMLLAKDLLQRQPGATIIYDVKSSRHVADVIEANGGKAVMSATGHSFIKEKLQEMSAALAGEMSGHTFYAENWYGFDDGIYTAARLLEIISKDGRPYGKIMQDFPKSVSTGELKIKVADKDKAEAMAAIKTLDFGNAEIIDIDGVRVEYPNGWGLIRQSNTSPYLIMRFEADDEAALTKIQQLFKEKLLSINSNWEIPL